ncbi:MAG: DUF362 domain-containing protein [Bacillota bacterium]
MASNLSFYQQANYNIKELEEIIDNIFIDKQITNQLAGKKVLLKVNLLMGKSPEKAVTTNPTFVNAVARTVKKYGGQPFLADSPGGPFNKTTLKIAYSKCGYLESVEAGEYELNYNTEKFKLDSPEGYRSKSFEICSFVQEADFIINLPKLKTHGLTLYTGAIKNLFGLIPGITKAEYHFNLQKISDFCHMLIDLHDVVKPELTIMDGIIGMEGDGPSSGNPRKFKTIIASTDAIYLDIVVSYLLRKDKYRSDPWPATLNDRGISIDFDQEIIPEAVKENFIEVKTPRVDKTSNLVDRRLPESISQLIEKFIRPKPVVLDNCIACGICAKNCPAKVITIKEQAEIDLSDCIRCFCCQELCPHDAVEIKYPLLGRLLF